MTAEPYSRVRRSGDEVLPYGKVYERVSEHRVSALPEDHGPGDESWDLTVEWRGNDRWAVKNGSFCFDADGYMEPEHIPSERRDEWLARFRFTEGEALALARQFAPKLRINGMTAADLVAWRKAGCPR